MSTIAIIPARGGSKRIPRKNIVPFRGRPLIGWTIAAALDSAAFDRVIVSTDDPEIARISRELGAEVPFLRQIAADDQSTVSAAISAALDQAEAHFGQRFTTVAQLMPNCPLRSADEIRTGLTHFRDGRHDFQISAFEFGWMNPWWAARMGPEGHPEWLFPEDRLQRSQDLDRLYCPTGALWVADVKAFRAAGSFYGPGHVLCPMSWQAAIDIDDYADLAMAEALAHVAATRRGEA